MNLLKKAVNAWGVQMQAGNGDSLTPEFLDIFAKACRYQETKRPADFGRSHNLLTDEVAQAEDSARRAFVEAYKPWFEKHTGPQSHKG